MRAFDLGVFALLLLVLLLVLLAAGLADFFVVLLAQAVLVPRASTAQSKTLSEARKGVLLAIRANMHKRHS